MKAKWASWTQWEELQNPLRYIAQEIEAEQGEHGEQTDPKGQEKPQEGEQPPGEPTRSGGVWALLPLQVG